MKVNSKLFAGILAVLLGSLLPGRAQGTAFTYQGRLNNANGPVTGSYDFTFALYETNVTGGVMAGPVTNSAVMVSNGLFVTVIDFGAEVFDGSRHWLALTVCTNGANTFVPLMPRQPVTPAPYAIFAGAASNLVGQLPTAQLTGTFPASQLAGAVPSANLSGSYGAPVTFNNGADTFDGTFIGQFAGSSFLGGTFTGQFLGDGSGLLNLNASQFTGGTVPDARLAANVALLNSNQTFTAQNVFAQGIGIGNPNPAYSLDAVAAQAVGRWISTNSGNGSIVELRNLVPNSIEYLGAINFNNSAGTYPGQLGYIAGNPANQNNDYFTFRVGGDVGLRIQADPSGFQAPSVIGGFAGNSVSLAGSSGDVIAGGGFSGAPNTIYLNSSGVFIGGGATNQVGPDVNNSVIGGGFGNLVQASFSLIGGGADNLVEPGPGFAAIVGGKQNIIHSGSGWSSIGGGFANVIGTNGTGANISGGYQNATGTNAMVPVIGGGFSNSILDNTSYATIGGGFGNTIQPNTVSATIGGGFDNTIQSNGGDAVIAGGLGNTIQPNAGNAAIGGGISNTILTNAVNAAIGGGSYNNVLVNAQGGVIGGGSYNQVGGSGGVVPGGFGNAANGLQSFAAGTFAQATNNGAFVLADFESTNFYSSASNQLSARFTGGVRLVTGGAGLTLDGLPVLAGANGGSLTNVNAALLNGLAAAAYAPAAGSPTYIQNQNAGPQSASFQITGNASVGGTVTAAVHVGGSFNASGTVAVNALTLTNAFRIVGAGVGTATAAFVQLSAATNIFGDQTLIYNPLCDGDPNAILIATHCFNPAGAVSSNFHAHPIGVYYNGVHWAVYNDDAITMASNIAFNVIIIKR